MHRIRIEAAVHEGRGIVRSVPEKIFGRPDLAIVVTASPACLRGVYITAAAIGERHRFFGCLICPEEYKTGAWKKRLKASMKEAAESGAGGIVIYASCLDYEIASAMEREVSAISKEIHVPAAVLFRGALVSPMRPPAKYLPPLLASLPETGAHIRADGFSLPPPQSDFAGIAEFLQLWDTYNFLLDGGGCPECFALPADRIAGYRLQKSRFTSASHMKQGMEELAKQAAADYKKRGDGKPFCLLSSVMPTALDVSVTSFAEKIKCEKIPVIHLPSDGMHGAEEGIANALLALAKQSSEHRKFPDRSLAVLGAFPFETIHREDFKKVEEVLIKQGWTLLYPEDGHISELASLGKAEAAIVLSESALPLAVYFKKKFGQRFYLVMPFGKKARSCWLKQFPNVEKEEKRIQPAHRKQKILIAGDLAAAYGIYKPLTEGGCDVTLASYGPLPGDTAWYQQILSCAREAEGAPALTTKIFKTTDEWQRLARDADVIFCDRLLFDALGSCGQGKYFVPFPSRLFSEGLTGQNVT